MTKKTINTKQLTGNQVSSIVQSIKLFNSLGIKELGLKESTKLTKFMVDCSNVYTDIIKSISDCLKSQNDKLIADNEDKKELLIGLVTIRHDINACNKFIEEHKELESIVPILEQFNKDILELQDNLAGKLYTLDYNIDTLKLMRAIEATNPTVEQVTPISFLFN
jgi:hypothetical protein